MEKDELTTLPETKSVIIYLDKSSEAKKFDVGEVINFQALETAKNLIRNRIKVFYNQKDELININHAQEKSNIRINNTLAILGGRGSGKTSFIHSLKAYCDEDHSPLLALDIIDPTLVETKEHMLLHVISLLDTYTEEYIKKSNTYSNDVVRSQEKRAWRELLNKLAKGLCSIDGIDSKQAAEWNDDAYVLQRGMSEVSAARDLYSNLNALVGRTLELAGKKVLVLFFDDIDIDIEKAWKVLEVVRKYLSSPKIIAVISGDEELLSLAVRKAQWSIFGKEFLHAEEKNKEVLDVVRQSVEEQYFQKVLKPENRILLLTLNDLLSRSPKVSILVKKTYGVDKNELSIKEVYKRLLYLVGIFNPRDMDDCLSLLLNLPLRSQIQLLKTIPENPTEKIDWIYPLLEAMRSVFYTVLLQPEITTDALHTTPNFLVGRILKYLTESRPSMLYNYYQLQPISLSEKKNQTLFMLGCVFSLVSRSYPYLLIDFMLRIGYVRNSLKNKDDIPQFLLEDRDMRDLLGYYIAETETTFGNIKIYAFDKKRKKGEKKGIDSIFSNESSLFKILAYLPLCSIRYPGKQNSTNYYSLPYLLGFLYDVLRVDDDGLSTLLERVKQKKTYSSSSVFLENESTADIDSPQIDDENNKSYLYDGFLSELSRWKSTYRTVGNIAVNPLLLGRIMTRYSNAASMYKPDDSLEKAFTHHIIMFLNSVLVEEYLWGGLNVEFKLKLNNPTSANTNFILNLNKIQEHPELLYKSIANKGQNLSNYPFLYNLFASCPLLQVYIQSIEQENQKNIFSMSGDLLKISTAFSSKLESVSTVSHLKQASNLPKFTASNQGILGTITELKKHGITKDFALNTSFMDFKEEIESFFENEIKNISFKTLQNKINNGNVTW